MSVLCADEVSVVCVGTMSVLCAERCLCCVQTDKVYVLCADEVSVLCVGTMSVLCADEVYVLCSDREDSGEITVDYFANVTMADISATNGVVHVVDRVLLPSQLHRWIHHAVAGDYADKH
ncbi:hypothetical protein ACOMHN_020667 [Nucella lapillus]